ncbi:MAG: response regulator [Cytophagales bacterium]|nr:response regulator [Cytophagales bacterium]
MIVLVEDYQVVSMHMKNVLERAGYEVPAIFTTGEELIEFLKNANPDLVLMDVMLEGELDGINTIDIVRNQHKSPVIFLTALSDSDSIQRIGEIKNCTLINKPFDEAQLVSTVEQAVVKGFS